jgi:transposase-like protein
LKTKAIARSGLLTKTDFEPIARQRQGLKMTCHNCSSLCKKFGKFGPQRIQRYRCKQCKRTFSEEHEKPQGPLGDMQISLDKAETILKLMLEGMSIRSIQRITGAHQRPFSICW